METAIIGATTFINADTDAPPINTLDNLVSFPNSYPIVKKRHNPRNYNKNGESQEVYAFKDINDINKIKSHLLSTGYNDTKYRDYLLFVLGINVGLRCSDIIKLKWEDVFDNINSDSNSKYNIVDSIIVSEQKTKYSTNKKGERKRTYKKREIFFNNSVKDAMMLYLSNTDPSLHTGYIFKSQRKPHLDVGSVNKIIKSAAKACNIRFNVGTHSLRKTFGYHQLINHKDDSMFLSTLCDMFGHSSVKITLRYCGIESDNFKKYYNEVCL